MKQQLLFFLVLCLSINIMAQTTHYVTQTGSGDMSGSSWANASNDIQDRINNATSNDAIFIAVGTYYPTRPADNPNTINPNNRNNAFVLKDGVKIYGGFDNSGTQTSITERYDIHGANSTILSADFNDDDVLAGSGSTLSITNNNENAYHVVISINDSNSTIIDGLTIKSANANGTSGYTVENVTIPSNQGAGMYLAGASNPSINNVKIIGNNGTSGGAMYLLNSQSVITNCVIEKNVSTQGAFHIFTGAPQLVNTIFNGNTSSIGGAMVILAGANTSVVNSVFYNNTAPNLAGAIAVLGANLTISNSIFKDNALAGVSNTASADIGASSSTPTVINCLTQANSAQQGTNGLNNIDPLFTDAANGDFTLQMGSQAIDAGDNASVPASIITDAFGNPRVFGTAVDMGVFEYNSTLSVNDNVINSIKIFPNPSAELVTIEGTTVSSISVFSVLGKKVLETQQSTFNISHLSAGAYTLRITSSNGQILMRQIIKQ